MTTQCVKLGVIRCALFSAAVLTAWTLKQAAHPPAAAPAPPQPLVAPLLLADLTDPISRVALAQALVAADAPRLREIAEILSDRSDQDLRVWRGLFQCWMKAEPKEAWGFALQHATADFPAADFDAYLGDPARGHGKLCAVAIEQWGALDPRAARAALGGPAAPEFLVLVRAAIPCDVEYGFRLLDELLTSGVLMPKEPNGDALQWLKHDWVAALARKKPELALDWARRLDPERFLAPLLQGWADCDWPAARSWLEQQPNRTHLLDQTAQLMAADGHDYRPYLFDVVLAALPPGSDKAQLVLQIFESLAGVDAGLAVRECARCLPDPATRAETIGKIAQAVAYTHPRQAWEIVNQLDPAMMNISHGDIPKTQIIDHGDAKELDPLPGRQQWLTLSSGPLAPAKLKSALLRQIMMTDKSQALAYLAQCPTEQLGVIGRDAIEIWTSHDPEEAANWLADKIGTHHNNLDLEQWFADAPLDARAMRTLAETLPEGTVRDAFAAWSAAQLASNNPTAALEFARLHAGAGDAVAQVYQVWSGLDPQAAIQHLAADPAAPPAAWRSVVENAYLKLPEATNRLVEALPAGAARDTALVAMVTTAVPTPQTGARWACDIGDTSSRHAALDTILTQAGRDLRLARDAATATTLGDVIDAADLMPDAEKQRWHERIEQELPPP